MKSEEYWKKRQEEKLNSILKKTDVTSDYISKIYHKAYLYTKEQMESIFDKYKTNYGLSEKEAKQLLSTLTNSHDYDEMKKKLQSNLTNDQRKELLKKLDSQAYQYRINKFKDMQNKLDDLMKNVYNIEVEKSTDTYIDSAFHAYYRNVYNLQQGTGVAYNFNTLDPQLVDDMLHSKWSGENYSQRIWNNTTDLANSVKDEMMMGVLTNKTEKEMADTIMKKFAVGAYQSRRLIQTESAAMSSFADQLAYEDAGIEKEMFIAVHDGRTSKVCQQHDRSIIDISKAQVGVNVPPLHPNCRSHMIPYIEGISDNMKQRQRNPKTGRDEVVDVNENYEQWLKRQQQEHGVDTGESFKEKITNKKKEKNNHKLDFLPEDFVYSHEKERRIYESFIKIDKLYMKDGCEHLVLHDKKTGKVLSSIVSSKSRNHVEPDEKMINILYSYPNNSLTAIHNHPGATPFSVSDIITCNNIESIGEIIVINNNGESYYLSIPENARIIMEEKEAVQEFKMLFLEMEEVISEKYPAESKSDIRHLAIKAISERYGWIYGRKREI